MEVLIAAAFEPERRLDSKHPPKVRQKFPKIINLSVEPETSEDAAEFDLLTQIMTGQIAG